MGQGPLTDQTLNWVQRSLQPGGQAVDLLGATPLAGATSSSLYRIGVQEGRRKYNVVLRLFTNAEWLKQEPDLPRHEAASLEQAAVAGVPTPRLIATDEAGEACGVAAVLMTEVPGRVELLPEDMGDWLAQLARALASVHRLQAPDHAWNYFSWNNHAALALPTWSKAQAAWAEAISIAQGPRPDTRTCFIHRDYHPVNVLWEGGRLSGIVDWVNACRGPAGIDVGHCRLNLSQMYGVEVADAFLKEYETAAGRKFTYDPYWDLKTAMDWLGGPPEIYQPWVDFGLAHLTTEILAERFDAYITSLVRRLHG